MYFVITNCKLSHYNIQFFTTQEMLNRYIDVMSTGEVINIVDSGKCEPEIEITLYHTNITGMVDIYDGEKTREYLEGKNE
jgi:hypothetical protein